MSSDTLAQATLLGPLSGIGLTSSGAEAHFVARVKATEDLVKERLGTSQGFVDNSTAAGPGDHKW